MNLHQNWPLLAVTKSLYTTLEPAQEAAAKVNFLPKIQQFAKRPVKAEDVHIRGTRIINSKPASFYGVFSLGALQEVAELIPGRPLMFEHNYDTAPVGRFFAGKRVFMPETSLTPRKYGYWTEGLFYVPADAEGTSIVDRVDLGVYSETSLAWAFLETKCSICKADIRSWECGHWPGEIYDPGGLCTFEMSKIVDVLEGSIVYAGAERGTHFYNPNEPEAATAHASEPAVMRASRWVATLTAQYGGVQHIEAMLASKRGEEPGSTGEMLIEAMFSSTERAHPRDRAEPRRSEIQTVLCSKDRFESKDDAAKWCRENSFAWDKHEESREDHRFTQRDAADLDPASLRTIAVTDGVQAVIGSAKKSGGAAQASASLLESLFAA